MYNIVICDDDNDYISYIKTIIIESGMSKNDVSFYEFASGEDFLEKIHEIEYCDLIVLDMQMKNLNGHETAAMFRKRFPKTTLVFCSGVCKPTDESFKVTPFRYLFKSYSKEKMIGEMQSIIKEMRSKKEVPYITGSYYYNTIRLEPDDILYIENYRFGSVIHIYEEKTDYQFEESEKITTKKKLNELYEILHVYGFEYPHTSYIVNMKYIVKMPSNGELKLKDGTMLTISRSKLKEFREAFSKWVGHKY